MSYPTCKCHGCRNGELCEMEPTYEDLEAEVEKLKAHPMALLSCEAAKRAIQIFESEYVGGMYVGEAVTGLWKYSVKEAMDGETSEEIEPITLKGPPKYACKKHGEHASIMNMTMTHGELAGLLCIVEVFGNLGIDKMTVVE